MSFIYLFPLQIEFQFFSSKSATVFPHPYELLRPTGQTCFCFIFYLLWRDFIRVFRFLPWNHLDLTPNFGSLDKCNWSASCFLIRCCWYRRADSILWVNKFLRRRIISLNRFSILKNFKWVRWWKITNCVMKCREHFCILRFPNL